MMTGNAVERRPRPPLRVLGAMALDAPAHGERWMIRLEPDEVEQVVVEVTPRMSPDHAHPLDRSVAGLAGDGGLHVRLVREVRELRDLVDPHPRDRLPAPPVLVNLGDLRIVLSADDL